MPFVENSGGAAGSGTVTSVTATDTSIVVAGTAVAPTVATATLDVIAAVHPPVAAVALNAQKLSGLADGVDMADAPTLSQARRSGIRPTAASFENIPRGIAMVNTLASLISQRVYLTSIYLPSGFTALSISFVSGATALIAGNHQVFGLYDSSLNLLRSTTDDTSTAWGGSTLKTLNLTSSFPTTYSGLYYVGLLVDAATVPSFTGSNSTGAAVIALTPVVAGTSNTGQTSLPNPANAPTANATNPYCYVSG